MHALEENSVLELYKELYKKEGYIFIPALLSVDNTELLFKDAINAGKRDIPERVLESNNEVNSVWNIHEMSNPLKKIATSGVVFNYARKILGDNIYIHQSKVNYKNAFSGKEVRWHQDFIFWHLLDGMPEPNCLTAAIFLDDVTELNSPLMIIPKSHHTILSPSIQRSRATTQHDDLTEKKVIPELTYELGITCIQDLAKQYGVQSIKGPKGSVLFFHSNLVHASTNNLSPYNRSILFITYNLVSNSLINVNVPRPHYIANRNFQALNGEVE